MYIYKDIYIKSNNVKFNKVKFKNKAYRIKKFIYINFYFFNRKSLFYIYILYIFTSCTIVPFIFPNKYNLSFSFLNTKYANITKFK